MNNTPAIIRTLVIYAICVPLAVWIGAMLTNQWDRTEFIKVGALAMLLLLPILLRWHHLLLVFCWNLPIMLFFLPGSPMVVLPMIVLSLLLSVLQRALSRDMRFLSVPALTWPMLFMTAVVYATGKLTGGFGLRSLGNEVMGGKKYAFIFLAIMGYFALTSRRIPPRQAWLYLVLFFLPGCVGAIGDLVGILPSSFNFIFLFFPANGFNLNAEVAGDHSAGMRLGGVSHLAGTFFSLMLVRYGLRGIFLSGSLWRIMAFSFFLFLSMAGGFRNILVGNVLLIGVMFFLEGLHRTRIMPLAILGGAMSLLILLPFAGKLPFAFQRTLSLIPFANVSYEARQDAEASTDWRYQIWKAVLPQVPEYLLLGKGYALSPKDMADMNVNDHYHPLDAADRGAAIAGDYHSGPLSVVIPFGIWGVIAYLWMMIGGGRVMYNNCRYGDPALRTANTFLFASFITSVFFFLFVFGGLNSDMLSYAGLFSLSVSLNGGMCRKPAAVPVQTSGQIKASPFKRPSLQPFFPR